MFFSLYKLLLAERLFRRNLFSVPLTKYTIISKKMSLHYLLLQFSSLTIVIKQDDESTIYDQLSNLYDVINTPLNWTWPVDFIQRVEADDERPGMVCLSVRFERRPSAIGVGHRTWCTISFDGLHTIFDNYVPCIIDSEEQERAEERLKVRQCWSCSVSCPDFYPDPAPISLIKSKESVIVVHVKMQDKITNLKLEIAECLDILMYLCVSRFRFVRPENPVRNVIFTKSLGLSRESKKSKVTFDGSLEFDGPQCVSVGYHGNPLSLFCSCEKI